jgi:hypothetical protein
MYGSRRSQFLSPLGHAIPVTLRENLNHRRCWDRGNPQEKLNSS